MSLNRMFRETIQKLFSDGAQAEKLASIDLTREEIELIKKKRLSDATTGNNAAAPHTQERSFDCNGRDLRVINETLAEVTIVLSEKSYIEVFADNKEQCSNITTSIDSNTVRIGMIGSSNTVFHSNGSFNAQGHNASVSINCGTITNSNFGDNGVIHVGANHGLVTQVMHGNAQHVAGRNIVCNGAAISGGTVFRQIPKVTIHVPNTLLSLTLSAKGSGSIISSDDLLDTSASVELSLSGSGNIVVAGKCQNLNVNLVGSGNIKAKTLLASNASLNLTGSGVINASVCEKVNANLAGSGNINIVGSPSEKQLNKTGSGRISSF